MAGLPTTSRPPHIVSINPAPLSLRLTGFSRVPACEPLGMEIVDHASASNLSIFTLPERAALVALCQSVVDAAEMLTQQEREDA
jgi:hypothetical protein